MPLRMNTVEPLASGGDRMDDGSPETIEWLDARQAAAYVCIGVGTVRDACNRKALRHVRVGGRARGPIRTRREWVDEWLEGWVHGGECA